MFVDIPDHVDHQDQLGHVELEDQEDLKEKKVKRDVDLLVKCAGESKRQGDLIEKVHTITRMHEPKVIRTDAYEIANQVLLNFLKEALGDKLSKEAEAAFKKLLDAMISIIDKELDVIDNVLTDSRHRGEVPGFAHLIEAQRQETEEGNHDRGTNAQGNGDFDKGETASITVGGCKQSFHGMVDENESSLDRT